MNTIDVRRLLFILTFGLICNASCSNFGKSGQSCLNVKESTIIDGMRFSVYTKIFDGPKSGNYEDIFLKVYMRVTNERQKKSLLFSSKNVDEYNARYKYLSFSANNDFILKIDSSTILPLGYNFFPSNEVSQYDELVYSFRIPKKKFDKKSCSGLNIQFWYVDHIAGVGNICFRPQ